MKKVKLSNFKYDYGSAVSIATARSRQRAFSLENRSAFIIKKWQVDGVIFGNANAKRCDFLMEAVNTDRGAYFWIELKGGDIVQACRQIMNTLDLIEIEPQYTQEARIITSGTNRIDIRSSEYKLLHKRMRSYNGQLKTYTNQGVETI